MDKTINPVYEFLPYFQMMDYLEKLEFWRGYLFVGKNTNDNPWNMKWYQNNSEYFEKESYLLKQIIYN